MSRVRVAGAATVSDGMLDFYIDVPNCSNGWADSWANQQFAIAAVTPGNDAQRVTASYWWPARVCG
jgi:hypothetical protein